MASDTGLLHMVYFWMREDGEPGDADKLAAGCKKHLRSIPGVLWLEVGFPAEKTRDVVDDTYGVALLMEFNDNDAQEKYQEHPDHLKFIAECSHLWSRVQVYDTVVSQS